MVTTRLVSLFRRFQDDGMAFWKMGVRESQTDSRTAPAVLRVVLYGGEVCRLPRSCRRVRVLSGQAWITLAGRDVLLTEGEQTTFTASKAPILVSGLGSAPLVLEAERKNHAHFMAGKNRCLPRRVSAESPAEAV